MAAYARTRRESREHQHMTKETSSLQEETGLVEFEALLVRVPASSG